MILSTNKWIVTGEVYNIRELEGEFGASVKIRGEARRPNLYSSQILELLCLLTPKVYEDAKRRGLCLYKTMKITGHLETWKRTSANKIRQKIMFIADSFEEVE